MSTSLDEAKKYLEAAFRTSSIMKTMGMTLTYDSEGNATVLMPRHAGFDHGMRDTHGGVLATMLDSAGWFTVAARCRKMVVTADLHVRMLQGAKQQDLAATAQMVRGGSKLAIAEMRLTAPDGQLVATGTASFSILGDLAI
ncbi:MAG: PaaI family thioesterase [Ramlibacter sp.]|nr:PaaI family thioesterase [Ramlibacter sp.]